jgi:two-component system cell cycle sensor histidine kinase/response regulator CckA
VAKNSSTENHKELEQAYTEIKKLKSKIQDKQWIIDKTETSLKALHSELEKANADLEKEKIKIEQKFDEKAKTLSEVNQALKKELKKREQIDLQLKQSQQSLNAIINNTPDIIYKLDTEGKIIFINDAVKNYGYNAEELIGTNIFNIVHPQDRVRAIYRINERRTGVRSTKIFELRLLTKDQLVIPFEAKSVTIQDESVFLINAEGLYKTPAPETKGFQGTQGVARDITARKKAEDSLRESEERYRQIVEISPDAFFVHCDQKIVLVNTAGMNLLGAKNKNQLLGKKVIDFIHPDDQSSAQVRWEKVYREKKAIPFIKQKLLRLDKKEIIVELSTSPFIFQGKQALQILARDITERESAEVKLARLASVVEQASESIVITNIQGKIEYANPAFEKTTGFIVKDVLGKNPNILKSGKQDNKFYQQLWETITTGETWNGTFINKKKNGALFYEDAVIFSIKDNSGQIINYAAVKRDITNEKKLEQQLFQSQKMESIGLLAGNIAHDFNNILTAINGYAELVLTEMPPDSSLHGKVTGILKAGRTAGNLTRQLLAFSRKQIIEPKTININEIIAELDKMLHRLIGEDIKMDTILPEHTGAIKADPAQIEQILINLVVNARDAINQNSASPANKRITIETSNVYLDDNYVSKHLGSMVGPHVILSVSDTGIGMNEETKRKIYEPFFTTKESGKGTGLGLATVYGIVKQNNGCIYTYSEPRHGTNFKIYWPISHDPQLKEYKKEDMRELIGGSEKVLVVEDDVDVRNITCTALDSLGYRTLNAENGLDALNKVQGVMFDIDLIITDVIMPEMGGKELAQKLKQIIPHIKTIFSSGYTDDHIVHSGILDEGVNFLHKPYSIQSLAKKVRSVLDN